MYSFDFSYSEYERIFDRCVFSDVELQIIQAKRDSMGRYSSEGGSYDDGSSYDDYSERADRRYSRDDAKDHMMNKLGSMMENADPNEREILKDCMRKLERA